MSTTRRGVLFGAGLGGLTTFLGASSASASSPFRRIFHRPPAPCRRAVVATPLAPIAADPVVENPLSVAGTAPHAFFAGSDITIRSIVQGIAWDGIPREFTLFGLFTDPSFKAVPRYRITIQDTVFPNLVWDIPENSIALMGDARLVFKAGVEPDDPLYSGLGRLAIRLSIVNSVQVGYREVANFGLPRTPVHYSNG